jgi:hypothetical protein
MFFAANVSTSGALNLAASNLAFGALNQTTHINAGGDITQSGPLTITGTAGSAPWPP